MKPGTILIIIGAALIAFVALAVFSTGLFNFPMLGVGVVGLVVAGVGASRRWERATK